MAFARGEDRIASFHLDDINNIRPLRAQFVIRRRDPAIMNMMHCVTPEIWDIKPVFLYNNPLLSFGGACKAYTISAQILGSPSDCVRNLKPFLLEGDDKQELLGGADLSDSQTKYGISS